MASLRSPRSATTKPHTYIHTVQLNHVPQRHVSFSTERSLLVRLNCRQLLSHCRLLTRLMLQGTTVPPGFSGCSSFPGLLLKANLSWIYAGLNPPFLLRVGMSMQCMHSAILLWKIRPSVRPTVGHTLVLYRNECAIVKLFPTSGRDVTPVFFKY